MALLLGAGVLLAASTLLAGQANPGAIDLQTTRWLQQFDAPWFAGLMYWVSWPGFSPQSVALPLAVALAFGLRGRRGEALWIIGTQASSLVTFALKQLVDRPRPAPELVGVTAPLSDPSFPSGHTVQYTTLFGFAFFLVYVRLRPSAWRRVALVLLAVPVLLVGISRLYLGQHWLSDVLGGYAVATLLLVPYCWAYATLTVPGRGGQARRVGRGRRVGTGRRARSRW